MPPSNDTVAHFPKAGIDRASAFGKQPAKKLPSGKYARTTRQAVNVRAYEPATMVDRGGSRAGLSKLRAARVAGVKFVVQELRVFATVGATGPGGVMPQVSQSSRVVNLVAVSLGNAYSTVPGGTAWTASTNNTGNTPPLNQSGILFSAAVNQRLYFADGNNWVYFDPATNTVETWTASAGTLPVDSSSRKPRLICDWRGRIVLSGLIGDPQNWFMSRAFDPTDFDYSPATPDPQQAVAGNNSAAGQIGDIITALVPYSDDLLFFGGDSTIYRCTGDPADGGTIDRVSDGIGFAWGEAWCKDPGGTLYFMSNLGPIFMLDPAGGPPQRISVPIDPELRGVDTGNSLIRLLWNDRQQGLHVFITPADAPAATTHYFWEQRAGAWWRDTFVNHGHDPLCCCVLDGNGPDDRVALIGCWDGYVRAIDPNATDDDGYPIESEVYLGPFLTPEQDDMFVAELQAALSEATAGVRWDVFAGETAEGALANPAVAGGVLAAGRNPVSLIHKHGRGVYVRLKSSDVWAMESIRVRLRASGMVRRRSG